MSDKPLLPVDLVGTFLGEIEAQRRPEDGLLHPSGDLIGSLRHSMLRAAGAPMKARPIAQDIRLMHGTLWHEWFAKVLTAKGIPFHAEMNLGKWMPDGWTGTADWVFWHPEYEAWVLGDLKTIKGEGIYWIHSKGAKEEHIWQMSAYWHALVAKGLPMLKSIAIMYWPMNDTGGEALIEPVVQEVEPIEFFTINGVMTSRWEAVKAYKQEVLRTNSYVNDLLEPPQGRTQKSSWNKKQQVFDVKLVPHWSAAFCDFDTDLCDCSLQGTTKIGHFQLDGRWVPRKGYEEHTPLVSVMPTLAEFNRRRREVEADVSLGE